MHMQENACICMFRFSFTFFMYYVFFIKILKFHNAVVLAGQNIVMTDGLSSAD